MKKLYSSLTWLLLAALLLPLAGCDLPTPLPTCTEAELQAPIDLDPDGEWIVIDIATTPNVTLHWSYPSTTCAPDFFEAYVWTGLEPETPGMTGRVNYVDEVSPGEWQMFWPTPLEPGKTYYWRIYAGLETGPGPDVDGPSSTLAHFFTGPVCTDDGAMQPVDLISPADGITVAPDEPITFAWDDPTPCLVDGLFEISFATNPDFIHRGGIPILQTVYTTTPAEMGLDECTLYYWRIKTDPAGPQEEPFSEIRTFFVQPEGIICSTIRIPDIPFAVARADLNCRFGPTPDYPLADAFYEGSEAPIEGRNADSSWWLITSPNLGVQCWVWAEEVDVEGDTSGVEFVEAPPLSQFEPAVTDTPEPVNCAEYTNESACIANPACRWELYLSTQGGHCVNR